MAKNCLKTGDSIKASPLAEKSNRLYPTIQVKEFLLVIKNSPKKQGGVHLTDKRKPTENTDRKFSPEQQNAVKAVLACKKDYYKVLAVEKTATDIEIKKAYRKKALIFHPDKNSAPGADEAFKLVAEAFGTLSDSNKRAIHDQGGTREMPRYRRRRENMSREEMYNAFFERQHRPHHYQRRQEAGFGEYFPFIMIILVLVLSILVSVENEPLYAFEAAASNTQKRDTAKNNIRYYVNPNTFSNKVGNSEYRLRYTENQIEIDWVTGLQRQCLRDSRWQVKPKSCQEYERLARKL
ncbi:unnamed protein product [Rhizopus stolonifer]